MPVVPSTIEVVVEYNGAGGATAANVLHFVQIGGSFNQSTMDDLTAEWELFARTLMSEDWIMSSVNRCIDLREDPPDEIFAQNTPTAGAVLAPTLPAQCAVVLSLSGGGGRRRSGRIYLPGIAESSITDGSRLDPTMQAACADGLDQFVLDAVTNTGWLLAVYSRVNGTSVGVSSISVDGVVDTQRRRVSRLA